MTSSADIDAKFLELKGRGLDLGAKQGPEQNAHSGGRVQVYERGRIYWHPNTGAREVHGGILIKYLSFDGPGVNPATGRRDFGYPISDEIRTADGLYPVSHFEFGSIVWGPVGTSGGVGISGDFRKVWENQGRFEDAAAKAQHRGAFELSSLGYPITDHVQGVAGGEAIYFQRGCFWKGPASLNVVIVGRLAAPLLSRPKLINPDQPSDRRLPRLVQWVVNGTVRDSIVRQRPSLFEEVWRDRLVLQRVAKPGEQREEIPLLSESVEHFPPITTTLMEEEVGAEAASRAAIAVVAPDTPGDVPPPPDDDGEQPPLVTQVFNNFTVPPNGTSRLQDRNLYNLGLRLPARGMFVMAPHAFYTKKTWDNFGFIHATDLHVGRRMEGIRRRLRELGLADGANEYSNFNDNFRELIRYANFLHDSGTIDFIVATGDLVDYVFEDGDNRRAGGNFAFLEQLILGRSPSPEAGVPREELRVPIFTNLGNHDYRVNPYSPLFTLDIPDPDWRWWASAAGLFALNFPVGAAALGATYWLSRLQDEALGSYGAWNLTEVETAKLIGSVPSFELESEEQRRKLKRMVDIDKAGAKGPSSDRTGSYDHYFLRFVEQTSYMINLGPHRLVMLDSGPDVGIPDDVSLETIVKLLAREVFSSLDEDTRMAMAGSPNLEGVGPEEIQLVRQALGSAGSQGIVIVGMHAPPVQPQGSEFSHYFRETEHPTLDPRRWEVEGFLQRHTSLGIQVTSIPVSAGSPPQRQYRRIHIPQDRAPDWPYTRTRFFKKGTVGDLMDYGIARGQTDEFLKLCAGAGASRKVDLVLCGHAHDRVEYRLGWDPSRQELHFHSDFYTENPLRYYTSLQFGDPNSLVMGPLPVPPPLPEADRVHISVESGAPLNARPEKRLEPSDPLWKEWLSLRVPPYADPLNSATDARAWWNRHRPLILQTASLGPIDRNQRRDKDLNPRKPNPSFQGVRVFSVANNVISKGWYVRLADVRAPVVSGEVAQASVTSSRQ